jgi:hypothetical protein
MSIQTISGPATYRKLLPLYLLALKGGDEDDYQMSEIRLALKVMATHADRWLAHCDEIDAKEGSEIATEGPES